MKEHSPVWHLAETFCQKQAVNLIANPRPCEPGARFLHEHFSWAVRQHPGIPGVAPVIMWGYTLYVIRTRRSPVAEIMDPVTLFKWKNSDIDNGYWTTRRSCAQALVKLSRPARVYMQISESIAASLTYLAKNYQRSRKLPQADCHLHDIHSAKHFSFVRAIQTQYPSF